MVKLLLLGYGEGTSICTLYCTIRKRCTGSEGADGTGVDINKEGIL